MAKTKLQLECELLMIEHDIKHNDNNEMAFRFRATMSKDENEKKRNLQAAEMYAADRAKAFARSNECKALIAVAA